MQDLLHKSFGKLTVISKDEDYISPKGRRHPKWICECECGNVVSVRQSSLLAKTHNAQSCGCWRKERASALNKKYGTYHDGLLSHGRIYNIWHKMVDRCENPLNKSFKFYGALGISVCQEWHDFMKFKEWAEQTGYSEELTIDRIDTNGNYSPDNCRWITITKQQSNRRDNRYVNFRDETLPIAIWAKRLGFHKSTLYWRIDHGWSIEDALTTPTR